MQTLLRLTPVLLCSAWLAGAQTRLLRPGDALKNREAKNATFPATQEIRADVSARLMQMGGGATAEGKLTLSIQAEYDVPGRRKRIQAPERILIEIPLASTAEAYGESRECHVSPEGVTTFVYTAGLDEQNFMTFASAGKARDFHFLVNKYLCRALAASYSCTSRFLPAREAKPSKEMRSWRVGSFLDVTLQSKSPNARAEVTPVTLSNQGRPFDYAQCEKIAPSDGLCCVGGKTTAWHCGEKPQGERWRQVSGSCFHRETGGSCKE